MNGEHCRLYDEHLVKNIMVSAGLCVLERLKADQPQTQREISRFIRRKADSIIDQTIVALNKNPSLLDDEYEAS